MHDAIREAHELIGATLRDPRTQRQGRVVGMDLGRDQPAIYVLWVESAAAERIAMEPDDFLALMEHLRARRDDSRQPGSQTAAKRQGSSSSSASGSSTSATHPSVSKPSGSRGKQSRVRRKETSSSGQHNSSQATEELDKSRESAHEIQAQRVSERRSAQG